MYITSQNAGIHVVLYRFTVLEIKYCNKNRSKNKVKLLEQLLKDRNCEIYKKSQAIFSPKGQPSGPAHILARAVNWSG
jgi:hypothetical protein